MIVFYYLLVVLALGPWLLLVAGAFRRVRIRGGRLRRMQAEGAALAVIGALARWAAFDPRLANGYAAEGTWPYWLSRGELGLAGIGLMLFALGFFLERRPRPGIHPWPETGKRVAAGSILGAAAFSLALALLSEEAWLGLPWGPGRILFSFGCYPFAMLYFSRARARQDSVQAVDA